jgi:hypothetical protein
MNQQQAATLLGYIRRAAATVPTTLAEAEIMQPALQTIAGVAIGALHCNVADAVPQSESPAPAL